MLNILTTFARNSNLNSSKPNKQRARILQPNANKAKILNIGCGRFTINGTIGVDKWTTSTIKPDVMCDLDVYPWPFEDNSVDGIFAFHIFEHLTDWWTAFKECARILKIGGFLEVRVPDNSCTDALAYRDHKHIFNRYSFHGIAHCHQDNRGNNAWAQQEENIIRNMRMTTYVRIAKNEYVRWWIPK